MKNNIIYLNIAGFYIGIKLLEIEPPYFMEQDLKRRIENHYQGFLVSEKSLVNIKPDYWIIYSPNNQFEVKIQTIEKKVYIKFYEESTRDKITTYYHISPMHLQLILRKVCQTLLSKNNGLMIHASASFVNNKANIFLGNSGAGKSTIMTILNDKFPSLADDSIILKKEKNDFFVYQTPFIEKNNWVIKKSNRVKLGNIFFLKKADFNRIDKFTDKGLITKKFLDQFLTEREDSKEQSVNLLKLINVFNNFYVCNFNLKDAKQLIKLIENLNEKNK